MSALIPHKTAINPYLIVADVEKTIAFYEKAFGFKTIERAPGEDGKTIVHAELLFRDELVLIGRVGSCGSTLQTPKQTGMRCPVTVCLTTPRVDDFYAHAMAHGAISIEAPADRPWGARSCNLQDIDGYVWCVLTLHEHH